MESAKRKRKQQNQKEGQHGKAQRHGWTISIYIDPERDASVSRYLFFYSSLSLSLCVYVSLWRSGALSVSARVLPDIVVGPSGNW